MKRWLLFAAWLPACSSTPDIGPDVQPQTPAHSVAAVEPSPSSPAPPAPQASATTWSCDGGDRARMLDAIVAAVVGMKASTPRLADFDRATHLSEGKSGDSWSGNLEFKRGDYSVDDSNCRDDRSRMKRLCRPNVQWEPDSLQISIEMIEDMANALMTRTTRVYVDMGPFSLSAVVDGSDDEATSRARSALFDALQRLQRDYGARCGEDAVGRWPFSPAVADPE